MNLKDKLRKLDPQSKKQEETKKNRDKQQSENKKDISNDKTTNDEEKGKSEFFQIDNDDSKDKIIEKLAGKIIENDSGKYFLRELEYPLTREHGDYCLDQLVGLKSQDLAAIMGSTDLPDELDYRDLLFIDTETTGLMGGTGTIPFMIGIGFFTANSFIVKQYFMRDYDDETALMEDLADIWDDFTLFVSFNGKSFDLPLIKTRFIMNRMKGKTAGYHLDLLHASRRIYKHLSSCSLGNLENKVLQIYRHNDLPGREVPTRYFKYLDRKDPELLAPIFKHNLIDIVSLVTLLSHLEKIYNSPEECDLSAKELYNLGRCWENRKDLVKSINFYENSYTKAIQDDGNRYIRKDIAVNLSWQYKRADRWDEAVEIWETMIGNKMGGLFPYIELAKYYEHQQKDLTKAHQYTLEASRYLRENRPIFKKYSEKKDEIEHRLDRLERKLNKIS